jgi:hypothetical protein
VVAPLARAVTRYVYVNGVKTTARTRAYAHIAENKRDKPEVLRGDCSRPDFYQSVVTTIVMAQKVEFRGSVPESQYEQLLEKYPGDPDADDLSDSDILQWMVPEFLRMIELEEMRATRRYPETDRE